MPIAIASPEFGSEHLRAWPARRCMPNATMFFGIDPDKAFDMMELDFREGNAADATRDAQAGPARDRHRGIPPAQRPGRRRQAAAEDADGTATVDYTIAGVVWSPGIDVIVSMFDMGRQFDQRTAASMFGSLDDAKEDFGVDGVYLFAANLDYFVDKEEVLKDVQKQLGVMGMDAGRRAADQVRRSRRRSTSCCCWSASSRSRRWRWRRWA